MIEWLPCPVPFLSRFACRVLGIGALCLGTLWLPMTAGAQTPGASGKGTPLPPTLLTPHPAPRYRLTGDVGLGGAHGREGAFWPLRAGGYNLSFGVRGTALLPETAPRRRDGRSTGPWLETHARFTTAILVWRQLDSLSHNEQSFATTGQGALAFNGLRQRLLTLGGRVYWPLLEGELVGLDGGVGLSAYCLRSVYLHPIQTTRTGQGYLALAPELALRAYYEFSPEAELLEIGGWLSPGVAQQPLGRQRTGSLGQRTGPGPGWHGLPAGGGAGQFYIRFSTGPYLGAVRFGGEASLFTLFLPARAGYLDGGRGGQAGSGLGTSEIRFLAAMTL